jgi:hypothetical protein
MQIGAGSDLPSAIVTHSQSRDVGVFDDNANMKFRVDLMHAVEIRHRS